MACKHLEFELGSLARVAQSLVHLLVHYPYCVSVSLFECAELLKR